MSIDHVKNPAEISSGERLACGHSAEIRSRIGGVGVVELLGDLTSHAQLRGARLASALASDPSTKTVVLLIGSFGGDLVGLNDAAYYLLYARQHARLVAYLAAGCGPAFGLATLCHEVWGAPCGTYGALASDDQATTDEFDRVATDEYLRGLAFVRPHVNWRRLLHSRVNGEAAEAMGVVDALACDSSRLVDRCRAEAAA